MIDYINNTTNIFFQSLPKDGCGAEPCEPCEPEVGACCFWSCDYMVDIIWPDIENPEDVPDISNAMISAGWINLAGPGFYSWRKIIIGENCFDPAVFAAKVQELQGEVDGIVGGQGGFSVVTVDSTASGPGCHDQWINGGVTKQQCEEEYLGTFYAGKTCDENPCCSGSCDETNPCGYLATGWDCECVNGECVAVENLPQ